MIFINTIPYISFLTTFIKSTFSFNFIIAIFSLYTHFICSLSFSLLFFLSFPLFVLSVAFFIASNFFVWATNGGWHHPLTFSGMISCYADGVPFLWKSLGSTLVFGTLFFGAAMLSEKLQPVKVKS